MKYKRVVVKVGSSVLTQDSQIATDRLNNLVEFITKLNKECEVILVSSGAVSAGSTELDLDKSDIINRQTLASIGQPLLMKRYKKAFDKKSVVISQMLMTSANFDSKKQTKNAYLVIQNLLKHKVVPIINENDSIAIEELVFGDNDQLSAYVTNNFEADLLVILSDIDGHYNDNPTANKNAKLIKQISSIPKEELSKEHTPNSEFATGGIVTKLISADYLLRHNKEMFLCSGFDLSSVYEFLFYDNHTKGTLFR